MRKTLSFLLVLALAVCMLPGLALAEEAPAFAEDDLKKIDIPDNLVTFNCTTTGDSKNYGAISGGFDMDKEKPYDDGGVWKVVVQLKLSAYKSQYDADTGTMHTPSGIGSTVTSFTLKYVNNTWTVDGNFPSVPISVTCDGKHLMPKPDHPTADAIDGLGKDIVGVVCANVPAGQQSGRYYGLINGGFTSTEPMFNKEDKVYESTITLIPSAYCNQFSTDTGIMHNVLSTQTTKGLSFAVKYVPEKKMWMPVEEVKQMGIWVVCDNHEVQQPEMPMYPTTDNIGGLNDKIVAVLCTNIPAGQQSGRYYGLLNGGFTSTEPKLNDGMYESTITLIPSVYCNQFSTDTGIMHRVLSTQTTEGLSFTVKYDPEKKMWMPVDEVKQMGIWVVCDNHEVQTRYTVTYSDGMNGSIFATENYADLKAGDTTPAFKGSTYRYGYRFDGWKPAWSNTVTGNVTYVAQWTYVGGGSHYYPNTTPVPPVTNMPTTGDNSTTLWLALLLVSGGMLAGTVAFARKRRKTQ